MGEPAAPTPKDRAETRELARSIVESVRDDEAMPLGTSPMNVNEMRPSTRRDIQTLVFQLAQEIELLRGELNEASRVRDQLLRQLPED